MIADQINKLPLGPIGIIANPFMEKNIRETVKIMIDENMKNVKLPKTTNVVRKKVIKINIKSHIDEFFNKKKPYYAAIISHQKTITDTIISSTNKIIDINVLIIIQDKINEICNKIK